MRIDILFIQLAVMLLPGLIWTQLVSTYAMKEQLRTLEFLIRAFIFGVLTYLAVYFSYTILGMEFSSPQLGEPLPKNVDFADEILWSSIAAVIFAIGWIYGSTHRWMIRILNRFNVSPTHGKQDLWDLTFSDPGEGVEYVHVRDLEKGITYAGWVRGYSETGRLRELLLVDVKIWISEDDSFDVPMLYFSRPDSDLHVEFPNHSTKDRNHAKTG